MGCSGQAGARGHLFHHSEIRGAAETGRCYQVRTCSGDLGDEGYQVGGVLASYIHLHFASDPGLAPAFVGACESFRRGRGDASASRETP